MVGLHGSPLRKPYSIASAPSETARTGHLELLVQVDDGGGPDPHLERAAPGTRLDVEGPFGSFSLPPVDDEPALLMVAGGTGIAPLRSMMLEALNRPAPPRISLVYSARSVDELAYRDELEALAAAGRIVLVMTVTRDEGSAWHGTRGRIDRPMLAAALPAPRRLVPDLRPAGDDCGCAGQSLAAWVSPTRRSGSSATTCRAGDEQATCRARGSRRRPSSLHR